MKYLLIGIFSTLIFGFILFSKGCFTPEPIIMTVRPDTVFVDKPYQEVVIKRVEVEIPTKVYIYKVDTVFRNRIEKDTLISSIEFTPKFARIHTITPLGKPVVKAYSLENYKSVALDYEGRMAIKKQKHPKRKKLLKTLGKIGLFIGGFYTGKEVYRDS